MAYIDAADVYRVNGITSSQVSSADVAEFITEAVNYVENILGAKFYDSGQAQTEAESVTETYDGNGLDHMFLDHYPFITLTSLTINGTSVTPSKVYQYPLTGKIQLKDTAEYTYFDDSKPQLVTVVYTHGIDVVSEPKVKHFTAMLAGQMALITQIGGTFDDVTSFQLPEISGSLGEPYTNIREALNQLKQMQKELMQYLRVKPQFG